jgi:phage shock protein A
MNDEAIQIAVLKTEVDHLKNHIEEMRTDLKEIKATLAEARGGWKTLMLVAGVSSTLGAFLVKYSPWFMAGPR